MIIYGRSALALGYTNSPLTYAATLDVDAILPAHEVKAMELNDGFWLAQEQTNLELENSGLYFTHIFEEKQVILGIGWFDRIVAITKYLFKYIELYRPASEDLLLTKMMRVDPQDRQDMLFLLKTTEFRPVLFHQLLANPHRPPIPEIEEAFQTNRQWLTTVWLEAEDRGQWTEDGRR